MKAVSFDPESGLVACREVADVGEDSLADDQVLVRTESVDLSSADRAVITGRYRSESRAVTVLGQYGFGEVIATGSLVQKVQAGEKVYVLRNRGNELNGHAAEYCRAAESEVSLLPKEDLELVGADASLLSALLLQLSHHMQGTRAATKKAGLIPAGQLMFMPGAGRRGQDITAHASYNQWHIRNALIVGNGLEVLLSAAILKDFSGGRHPYPVSALHSTEAVDSLLEEIGIEVTSFDAVREQRFDAIQAINAAASSLEELQPSLDTYGMLMFAPPHIGQEAPEVSTLIEDDPQHAFVEPQEVMADYRDVKTSLFRIIEELKSGWLASIPCARLPADRIQHSQLLGALTNNVRVQLTF